MCAEHTQLTEGNLLHITHKLLNYRLCYSTRNSVYSTQADSGQVSQHPDARGNGYP
jgi:hypothetical protein